MPSIRRSLRGRARFREKWTTTVFWGLNVSPQLRPQAVSSSNILWRILGIEGAWVPVRMAEQLSAKTLPRMPYLLIISTAGSNAIAQNLAEGTPPWGKPVVTVREEEVPWAV